MTFPKPRTGQPTQSEPQDQRLPSEARMSPWVSPRLIAGGLCPTGNLSLPWLENPVRDIVTMPVTSKIAALVATVVSSFVHAMNLSVAIMCVRVEVEWADVLLKGASRSCW